MLPSPELEPLYVWYNIVADVLLISYFDEYFVTCHPFGFIGIDPLRRYKIEDCIYVGEF
jgi:hypothetical protein